MRDMRDSWDKNQFDMSQYLREIEVIKLKACGK